MLDQKEIQDRIAKFRKEPSRILGLSVEEIGKYDKFADEIRREIYRNVLNSTAGQIFIKKLSTDFPEFKDLLTAPKTDDFSLFYQHEIAEERRHNFDIRSQNL